MRSCTIYRQPVSAPVYSNPTCKGKTDKRWFTRLSGKQEACQSIIHPSSQIPKTYIVKTRKKLEPDKFPIFLKGINSNGELLKADSISSLHSKRGYSYKIVLHHGKKRHIRRMFKKLGHTVSGLKRTKIGNLTLGTLKSGEYRHLTEKDIDRIFS